MSPSPTLPAAAGESARLASALLVERLRLYRSIVAPSLVAQVLIAALVLLVLGDRVAPGALAAWLTLFVLGVAVRVAVARWWNRLDDGGTPATPSVLRRVRLAVIAPAVAWGTAGWLLFPAGDLQAQTFLSFVLAGIAAGSLTVTSFDLRAALAFAGITLAPLGVRLFLAGDGSSVSMATMVLLFAGFLALNGVRLQRNVSETLRAREAAALRAESLLENQARLQQLSDALQRNTEALRLTLASMDQGILSLGPDGRVNFYNQRLIELVELPESLLAARPTMEEIARYQREQGHFGADLELIDPTGRSALERWFAGEVQPFPARYVRRTRRGTMLEVKSHYVPGGGLVRTFSDVSAYFEAQQRLQDSEAQSRKLALVAAHTDNAVAITDARLRIEWVNEGFAHLTGYALDEVRGITPRQLMFGADSDTEAYERFDDALHRQQRAEGELLVYRKDGRPRWMALEARAIVDEGGQVLQYIAIGHDVSARRAAEEAMRAARDDAERASRAKSEFLSAMSHELRTPMNAILGFAQLLESDPALPLGPRQHSHVQQILRAGGHLLHLINDVLDLARVEAGKQPIAIEPIDVAAMLGECLALVRPLAEEREIALAIAAPAGCGCQVAADRTRLRQVMLNLLSNAIKYNRPGGTVQIACEDGPGDAVRLEVRDDGPGLTEAQRGRLFTAFERLGAEDGPVEGAGIGLALSRRLVELMHGGIGVDSEPGRGSCFWVSLPRAAAASTTPSAARADTHADGRADTLHADAVPVRTVLYIEDNPVNAMLVEAVLEREPGVRLLTAPLPSLGLDLARTERPDLVLLDIQLPGMDGFEVLRRLRAHEATCSIPVVAVSANAMRQDIERAGAAGFDGYLTKPIELDKLRAVVRRPERAGTAASIG